MEDKTIFEELLEKEIKPERRKLDKAYACLSDGLWDEAEELFRSVLKAEPNNSEAKIGLKLIDRQVTVRRRLRRVEARARHKDMDVQGIKKDDGEIKNRTPLWIALCVLLFCAGLAVIYISGVLPIGTDAKESPATETVNPSPAVTAAPRPTAAPTASPEETEPVSTAEPTAPPSNTPAPVPTPAQTPEPTPAPTPVPTPQGPAAPEPEY